MKAFWTLFWGVVALVVMVLILNKAEIYGGVRAAILVGGVLGVMHTFYNYEEIACTCDDPDHEH